MKRALPMLLLLGVGVWACASDSAPVSIAEVEPATAATESSEPPSETVASPTGAGEQPAAPDDQPDYQSWRLPPPAIETGPIVDPARLHVSTLPNGLRIMVLEDHRLPKIDLGLAVRRGAADEPIERAGLAAFLADVMERGAGERDALALAEAVDGLGASFSVAAGWDTMEAGVSGLSRDLDVLFGVLADLVLRPRFSPDEADKVRAQTLAALEKAKDDPRTLGRWNFIAALYGDHRYGLPASGSPVTVAALDADTARAFHALQFVPGNAILYASGDVAPADFAARAEAAFGAWVEAPVPEAGPPAPAAAPTARRVVIVDRPDLGQAQILIGHEGMFRTDPERVAAALMNSTLGGGGFSSRLMTVIREREGLAYGVSSGFGLRRGAGPFRVGTATRVAEARRAIDLILAELADIRGGRPPTAEELAHAQTDAAGGFALGLETSGAMLASLVDLEVHGLPLDGLDTYRARVAAVTPEGAAGQAQKRIHPDRAAIVVVGPAERLAPALADLGEVEIVQP